MMLGILAFALLFTAIMNYILITISSIVNRTKEVAVHKSYGASETNIHSMVCRKRWYTWSVRSW